MERTARLPLGVVLERREVDNRWVKTVWRPVSVVPGAAEGLAWKPLASGPGWAHFLTATLPLELHRKETEAYKINLSNRPPQVYVVVRALDDPDAEHDVAPFLVTASPYEAQDYLDSGDDVVEGVAMPEGVIAWVQAFVDAHHVEEPFVKRKRKPRTPEREPFGQPPKLPGSGRRGSRND
jgi:hypothetical protein